jgi:hypothetical protein
MCKSMNVHRTQTRLSQNSSLYAISAQTCERMINHDGGNSAARCSIGAGTGAKCC